MDPDPLSFRLIQSTLIDFSGADASTIDLLPVVWSAAEALTAPEVEARRSSLERLAEIRAIRFSPLIAYLTATRLLEPDLLLRKRVVQLLGELLAPDEEGCPAPEPVLRHVSGYLAQMRTRQITAVLQVIDLDPELDAAAARILNACPFGGSQLSEIASDRKAPQNIRRQAVRMIELVGYLDTLPSLERLEARLTTRMKGQQSVPFDPPSGPDESELLPAVQSAIAALRRR